MSQVFHKLCKHELGDLWEEDSYCFSLQYFKVTLVLRYNKVSQKIRETLEFLKLMLVVGTRKISLFLRLHIYLFFFQGDQLKAPYFVSKQWGSFFVDRLPGLENAEETLVRTWSCKCISTYSTIAIPSLEAIAGKEDGFFFFFF